MKNIILTLLIVGCVINPSGKKKDNSLLQTNYGVTYYNTIG